MEVIYSILGYVGVIIAALLFSGVFFVFYMMYKEWCWKREEAKRDVQYQCKKDV